MFPDTDEKFKDADSLFLLKCVIERLQESGYYVVNIDSTILAQKPKMKPYINSMRENIAKVCNLDINDVSVKATTEEGLGFTGRQEGIAAHAVVLIDN